MFAVAMPAEASPALTSRYSLNLTGYVLHMINGERAAHHLPSLQMQWRLVESADRHTRLMRADNTMSHQLPGEAGLGDRITATGFAWSWAGENVAWSNDMSLSGVRYLELLMYNERPPGDTGHRENILSRDYRWVGVAIRWDFPHHKVWLTEDFAG